MHLAQFNVARAIAPLEDPRLADFVAQLDAVNASADTSAGFVWRLKAESLGQAGYVHATDDPTLLINLTIWESVEALFAFTYASGHADVFRDRRQWFERPDGPSFVLWWVAEGEMPSVEDGYARLAQLKQFGPTGSAFNFKTRFLESGDRG